MNKNSVKRMFMINILLGPPKGDIIIIGMRRIVKLGWFWRGMDLKGKNFKVNKGRSMLEYDSILPC